MSKVETVIIDAKDKINGNLLRRFKYVLLVLDVLTQNP